MQPDPKLKEDERYCFKCKSIVHKSDFDPCYGICDECCENSTGH